MKILLFNLFTVLLLLLSFMGIKFAENVNLEKKKYSWSFTWWECSLVTSGGCSSQEAMLSERPAGDRTPGTL